MNSRITPYSILLMLLLISAQQAYAQNTIQKNIYGVSTSRNIYSGRNGGMQRNMLGRRYGSSTRLIGVNRNPNSIYGIRRVTTGRLFGKEHGLRANYFGSGRNKVFDSNHPDGNLPPMRHEHAQTSRDSGVVVPMSAQEQQKELARYAQMIQNSQALRPRSTSRSKSQLVEF